MRYLLKKHNILDREVTFLQFGEAQAIFAALQSGTVQAGILSYPTTAAAIKKGFKRTRGFLRRRSRISELQCGRHRSLSPDTAGRRAPLSHGLCRGHHRYKTGTGVFTRRVMGKYLRVQDQTVLDETYQLFAPRIPRIPYPTVGGFRLALESLSDEPRARTARPEEFYDDAILRSLEEGRIFSTALSLIVLLPRFDKRT